MFGFGKKKKDATPSSPAAGSQPPALPELDASAKPASGPALPDLPDLNQTSQSSGDLPEMSPPAPQDDFGLPSFDAPEEEKAPAAMPEAPQEPTPALPEVPEPETPQMPEQQPEEIKPPSFEMPESMQSLDDLEKQTGQDIQQAKTEEPSFVSSLPSSSDVPEYHSSFAHIESGDIITKLNAKEDCLYVDVDGFKQLAQEFSDAQEQFAEVSRLIRTEDSLIKKEESHILSLRSEMKDVHTKLKKIDEIIFEG